jgi:L-methionine (R)-S-oxide reductase
MSFTTADPFDMSTRAAKVGAYETLRLQAAALIAGEDDAIANLAQFSALVFGCVPDLNWAGFYLARADELVLGPFQGGVACTRISFQRGVCGAAARSQQIQIVPDVSLVADHIACDARSRSELVLPLIVNGVLFGVFDLDSPVVGRFDGADAEGMAACVSLLAASLSFSGTRV